MMSPTLRLALAALSVSSFVACAAGPSAPTTPAPAAPTAALPSGAFAAQVAAGQKLYVAKCAECHGDSGQGSDGGPAVVGLRHGALPLNPPSDAKFRKTRFQTVADVADFVVKAMPPRAGGSLTSDEYWSILAFDLKANGIDLGDKKLDAELAKTLQIPR